MAQGRNNSTFSLPAASTAPFEEPESITMDIDTETESTTMDIDEEIPREASATEPMEVDWDDAMEIDSISTSSLTGIPVLANFEGSFVKVLKGLSIDAEKELCFALGQSSLEQEDSFMMECFIEQEQADCFMMGCGIC